VTILEPRLVKGRSKKIKKRKIKKALDSRIAKEKPATGKGGLDRKKGIKQRPRLGLGMKSAYGDLHQKFEEH